MFGVNHSSSDLPTGASAGRPPSRPHHSPDGSDTETPPPPPMAPMNPDSLGINDDPLPPPSRPLRIIHHSPDGSPPPPGPRHTSAGRLPSRPLRVIHHSPDGSDTETPPPPSDPISPPFSISDIATSPSVSANSLDSEEEKRPDGEGDRQIDRVVRRILDLKLLVDIFRDQSVEYKSQIDMVKTDDFRWQISCRLEKTPDNIKKMNKAEKAFYTSMNDLVVEILKSVRRKLNDPDRRKQIGVTQFAQKPESSNIMQPVSKNSSSFVNLTDIGKRLSDYNWVNAFFSKLEGATKTQETIDINVYIQGFSLAESRVLNVLNELLPNSLRCLTPTESEVFLEFANSVGTHQISNASQGDKNENPGVFEFVEYLKSQEKSVTTENFEYASRRLRMAWLLHKTADYMIAKLNENTRAARRELIRLFREVITSMMKDETQIWGADGDFIESPNSLGVINYTVTYLNEEYRSLTDDNKQRMLISDLGWNNQKGIAELYHDLLAAETRRNDRSTFLDLVLLPKTMIVKKSELTTVDGDALEDNAIVRGHFIRCKDAFWQIKTVDGDQVTIVKTTVEDKIGSTLDDQGSEIENRDVGDVFQLNLKKWKVISKYADWKDRQILHIGKVVIDA